MSYMAPNYVYEWPTFPWQRETQFWNVEAHKSCEKNPAICMDAINRGLLSGLQKPIVNNESAFTSELAFFKYYSKVVPETIIPGFTTTLANDDVPGTVTFRANGQTYRLAAGEKVQVIPPQTAVVVAYQGTRLMLPSLSTNTGELEHFSTNGTLFLKSARESAEYESRTTYTVGMGGATPSSSSRPPASVLAATKVGDIVCPAGSWPCTVGLPQQQICVDETTENLFQDC